MGHRFGAEHLDQFLSWCAATGIRCVTAWVASADNMRRRDSAEVDYLMQLTETVLADQVRRDDRWRLHVAGQLDLLPLVNGQRVEGVSKMTCLPRHSEKILWRRTTQAPCNSADLG